MNVFITEYWYLDNESSRSIAKARRWGWLVHFILNNILYGNEMDVFIMKYYTLMEIFRVNYAFITKYWYLDDSDVAWIGQIVTSQPIWRGFIQYIYTTILYIEHRIQSHIGLNSMVLSTNINSRFCMFLADLFDLINKCNQYECINKLDDLF